MPANVISSPPPDTTHPPRQVWRIEVQPSPAPGTAPGRAPATTSSASGGVPAAGNSAGEAGGSDVALYTAARAHLGDALGSLSTAAVYLIEAALTETQVQQIADELLADPITQHATPGIPGTPRSDGSSGCSEEIESRAAACKAVTVEVHYLPGVMDPVADSTQDAIGEMLPGVAGVQVRTGVRYNFEAAAGMSLDAAAVRGFAGGHLANAVVQAIHDGPYWPETFPRGEPYRFALKHVVIRELDDAALQRMSREAHLFLSLEEMQAIQRYYRDADREPTDIELETLAQTWSEHCVHKTLKSTVSYRSDSSLEIFQGERPGHEVQEDGTVIIRNLLKSTVAAATFALRERFQQDDRADFLVSVFDDNAGIVKFDETDGIAIKVETHNHPSALEPYGGAATGIGGCIRDIMGTGLSAKPIANTNVFCVGYPQQGEAGHAPLPPGVIPPRRVLQRVVDGVRDYGNRMGIPTVNGAVHFHEDYLANPLVFAGCVGILPLDKCFGHAKHGDRIIILGGATGRDGIHGATFSSAELTDTHTDEFSHAVQIGNAITEKKVLDVLLQARDFPDPDTGETRCLFHAISDCGAGGFSSAVGEMAEKIGARVTLDTAPLKYDGLTYTEVWISEAQERMPLAVPPQNVPLLKALCEAEDVMFCDLGEFGFVEKDANGKDQPTLSLLWHGKEVGRLGMAFLHDGIPTPTREARWPGAVPGADRGTVPGAGALPGALPGADRSLSPEAALRELLGHPNIASKHWIIRQYDHEVQAGSVVKPLVGPQQDGPSDGAVLRPKLSTTAAITLSNGAAPYLSEKATAGGLADDGDSYYATLAAIDEAVRNAVCVGADPRQLAILDNFCWPRCDDPAQLGSLVRAAEACYDGAMAYEAPFVSGKDSLSNQFTTESGRLITIPPTLLITALGRMADCTRARTMDAKAAGNALLIVGATGLKLGGSHRLMIDPALPGVDRRIPRVNLATGPANARAVAQLIAADWVASAHDCAEGGLLVAAAEMAFAGRMGLELDLSHLPALSAEGSAADELDLAAACFAETPSRYLLEIQPADLDNVVRSLRDAGTAFAQIGSVAGHERLTLRTAGRGRVLDVSLDTLREAWLAPLAW